MHSFNVFDHKVDILLTLDDYTANHANNGSMWNLVATSFICFAFLWVLEYTARYFWSVAKIGLIKDERSFITCGRHTMDTFSMTVISYAGWEALNNFGGFSAFANLVVDGKTLAVGAERIYHFSPAAQRLCMLQVAYEAKNFCDSVIHSDGAVFLAHHILTGFVTIVAANPFMHLYAGFYLGLSELSTVVLCVLVCFDRERGIPGFPEAYPTLMTVLAVMFGALFIIFRMVLWIYVNYYFWEDIMALYHAGTYHSLPAVSFVMFVNAGLTALQFLWLKEIYDNAVNVLGLGGGPRGQISSGTVGKKSSPSPSPSDAVSGSKSVISEDTEPERKQPRRSAKRN
jgi:hypothetical protein